MSAWSGTGRDTRVLRIVVSAVALALAALHRVTGFTLDTETTILLVVALLPWLQPLIKSVDVLGVKLELQALKDDVAEAKGAAENAKQKAFFAQAAADATTAATTPPTTSTTSTTSTGVRSYADPIETLRSLADAYVDIRRTQRPGDPRTLAMTAIVRRMLEVTAREPGFDVVSALSDRHAGVRLAAYATLYARPEPNLLEPLVDSVAHVEDKPFGQYWGLQALGKAIDAIPAGGDVASDIIATLEHLARRFAKGTDRDYELRGILAKLQRRRSPSIGGAA